MTETEELEQRLEERVMRGRNMMAGWLAHTPNMRGEEIECMLGDMVADFMHYADTCRTSDDRESFCSGVDAIESGARHHAAEVEALEASR